MTLKEAHAYSVKFLEKNSIDEAEFKALCIVCNIDGIKNGDYLLHLSDEISKDKLDTMLLRLKSGEPLQYVLGKWEFYESGFLVGPGVLIPRPETEELVDTAIKLLKGVDNPVVIDLCSGSGCIGLSIAKKISTATVYCIEKSADAFKYLEMNGSSVTNAVLINEDINTFFDVPDADMILSNPPYIKTDDLCSLQQEVLREPAMALDGGADGLNFYRIINDKWYNKIKSEGCLLLEIGNEQGECIKAVLNNFNSVTVNKDIYGNDRIAIAKR